MGRPHVRTIILFAAVGIALGSFLILVCAGLGLAPTPVQEWRDERAVRRLFDVPSGYERTYYDGFPAMVGFGQREGLEISVGYRLTERQAEVFLRQAAADGWKSLPIPEAVRSKILFQGLRIPMESDSGLFLCQTAGNDVLHARQTRACQSAPSLPDIILGVLDADRAELHLVVRAGY
jgi:hypothetical protein